MKRKRNRQVKGDKVIKKEPIFLVGDDTVNISDTDEEKIGAIPEEPICPICDKVFKTLKSMVSESLQSEMQAKGQKYYCLLKGLERRNSQLLPKKHPTIFA